MVGKRAKLILILLLVMIISGVLVYPSWLWLGAVLVVYVIHAVLWTDHFYYQPTDDYSWAMPSGSKLKAEFDGVHLNIPESLLSGQTVLLKTKVSTKFSGSVFDPFVELLASEGSHKQHFERGCGAERYINLTPVIESLMSGEQRIQLVTSHCDIDREAAELIAFRKPELENKRVMVIAPHADDAEIAAFGLYKNTDSMVVTLTAGEAEPETFSQYCDDSEKAALLKGRVRAWDSVAIPKWAGLKEDRILNLGYFCMHLEQMHDKPDAAVTSKFAGTADTRSFRQFNSVKLSSDQHGIASWNSLVQDLQELVERF